MMQKRQISTLPEQFNLQFRQILTSLPSTDATPRVALAFSGGLDSTALLDLLNQYAQRYPIHILVFHIHHGLSRNADAWLSHSQQSAQAYGYGFDSRRIHLEPDAESGLEAHARAGRYHALGEMCQIHNIGLLLTAHHKDDVLETSLMNFFNGAGIFGMAGIDPIKTNFSLLKNQAVTLVRPLLQVSREQLANYVELRKLKFVEDESNQDQRFRRNLFRNTIIPQLRQAVPAMPENVARSIRHMQAGKRILQAIALDDFKQCRGVMGLSLKALQSLDADRLDNLLRYWMDLHQLSMPTLMQLEELKSQMRTSKPDARVEISLQSASFYLESGELVIAPRLPASFEDQLLQREFSWQGEAMIAFPEFFGRLHFKRAEYGLPEIILSKAELCLHFRRGGEILSLAGNRPGRELKKQYQQMKIAYWQRKRLPLLSSEGKLLFVAGLGNNAKYSEAGAVCYQLSWESDLMHLQMTDLKY